MRRTLGMEALLKGRCFSLPHPGNRDRKEFCGMNDTQFWNLIEQSRQETSVCRDQADRLVDLLTAFPADEIYDFDRHFARRRVQAYRWDLWAVAYIIEFAC